MNVFFFLWMCFSLSLSLSGCYPDPAGEAVNQMHWALLSHVGAQGGGIWLQTAAPARTGDAYSGTGCFPSPFTFFVSFSVWHIHTHISIQAALGPRCQFISPGTAGATAHITPTLPHTHTHTHTHTHIHPQCPLHSNEVALSQEDIFNIHTTQFKLCMCHTHTHTRIHTHNGRLMFQSHSSPTCLIKHTLVRQVGMIWCRNNDNIEPYKSGVNPTPSVRERLKQIISAYIAMRGHSEVYWIEGDSR